MKATIMMLMCLIGLNISGYSSNALLEHYVTSPFPGYSTNGFSVCGSQQKNFKLYYVYCTGPSGCGPSNLCITNANYRFLVTLTRDGNWVADHTFQGADPWTYDYFNNVTVTPGTYQMKVVFQKSNAFCSWINVNTTFSNAIVVSAVPPPPLLSITGASHSCHTSAYTYTVNGNTSGSGVYTWTSTNSTFRINGQPFPITTTSNTASINATVPGSTTTISVTLSGVTTAYCGQFNVPSLSVTSISTLVSMYGPDCIAPHQSGNLVASPTSSSGYTWQSSSDNVNWSAPFAQTNSNISMLFQTQGNYYLRVQRNMFGCVSNWATWTTICTTNCIPFRSSANGDVQDVVEATADIYPNPSTKQFFLKNISFESSYNLIVYDNLGRQVEFIQNIPIDERALTFGEKLAKGIYTVLLFNDKERLSKRICKD